MSSFRKKKVQVVDFDMDIAERPFLDSKFGEPINSYFKRLRNTSVPFPLTKKAVVDEEGLYIHKRPIEMGSSRNSGVNSSLLIAGTVFYHVLVYWKKANGKIDRFDFAPDNGCDSTDNFFEGTKARRIHNEDVDVPKSDICPFLFLGVPHLDLRSSPLIKSALEFVQSRDYHPITCNCIHFADFFVRLATRGVVSSVPLLYDITCGSIPVENPPLLAILEILYMTFWIEVCDGSKLLAAYRMRCGHEIMDQGSTRGLRIVAEKASFVEENGYGDGEKADKDDGDGDGDDDYDGDGGDNSKEEEGGLGRSRTQQLPLNVTATAAAVVVTAAAAAVVDLAVDIVNATAAAIFGVSQGNHAEEMRR